MLDEARGRPGGGQRGDDDQGDARGPQDRRLTIDPPRVDEDQQAEQQQFDQGQQPAGQVGRAEVAEQPLQPGGAGRHRRVGRARGAAAAGLRARSDHVQLCTSEATPPPVDRSRAYAGADARYGQNRVQ
jgi:hypothetical protein